MQRTDLFKMFILAPFVVYRPRGRLPYFPFSLRLELVKLYLHSPSVPSYGVYRYEFTTYFIQLLPDLKFHVRDLNIMLVNICEFLSNRRREYKEHLR
jgi:hypothetical protein